MGLRVETVVFVEMRDSLANWMADWLCTTTYVLVTVYTVGISMYTWCTMQSTCNEPAGQY